MAGTKSKLVGNIQVLLLTLTAKIPWLIRV